MTVSMNTSRLSQSNAIRRHKTRVKGSGVWLLHPLQRAIIQAYLDNIPLHQHTHCLLRTKDTMILYRITAKVNGRPFAQLSIPQIHIIFLRVLQHHNPLLGWLRYLSFDVEITARPTFYIKTEGNRKVKISRIPAYIKGADPRCISFLAYS